MYSPDAILRNESAVWCVLDKYASEVRGDAYAGKMCVCVCVYVYGQPKYDKMLC